MNATTRIAVRSAIILFAATTIGLPAATASASSERGGEGTAISQDAAGDPAAIAVAKDIVTSGMDSGVVDTSRASGWGRCPAGYYCIFDFYNGEGLMAYFKTGSPDLRAQGMNDKTSAVWNRSNANFLQCEGYNYTGACTVFDRGMQVNLHSWGGDNWDSSLRRL